MFDERTFLALLVNVLNCNQILWVFSNFLFLLFYFIVIIVVVVVISRTSNSFAHKSARVYENLKHSGTFIDILQTLQKLLFVILLCEVGKVQ